MKKLFFFVLILTCLLAACKDPSDVNTKPVSRTTIIAFDNREVICDVSVYYSHTRSEESFMARIPAGQMSQEFEWNQGNWGFYFVYHINLKGISSFTIDYIPEVGRDQIHAFVDLNRINSLKIPKLNETVSSPDNLLVFCPKQNST